MVGQDGIIGWILRGTKDPIKMRGISAHQVLKVVHDYGVRLGHHLHIYVPDPPPEEDAAAYDMLEVLLATGVVAGGPYFEEAERVSSSVRARKPGLFRHDPKALQAYRINEKRLKALIDTLDAR